MVCPHCGAQVSAGNRFCNRCRKRVVPESRPAAGGVPSGGFASQRPSSRPRPPSSPTYGSSSFKRPMVVTLLGILNVVGGVFGLGVAALLALGGFAGMKEEGAVMLAVGLAYGLIGLLQIATGVGLLGLKPWSRQLQIGLAVIGLLGIPCGTIVSILVLVYMLKPEVRILFSGASPRELAPEELQMVERLGESSGATVAIVVAVVVVVGIFSVGIIAAIAIPSLLRARVAANEAATIGDLRTVVSAEAAYASANRGFYDRPECLMRPTECIPAYPAAGPTFLDSLFVPEMRHGYRLQFIAGPQAPSEILAQGTVSPSSLAGFAYVAEPITAGQTGVRAFCAEASGVICFDPDGHLGDVAEGTCPADCTPFR
jgi:type IV pilus assembly protein PilA